MGWSRQKAGPEGVVMSKVRRFWLLVLAMLASGVATASAAAAEGTCVEAQNVPPPRDVVVCVPV